MEFSKYAVENKRGLPRFQSVSLTKKRSGTELERESAGSQTDDIEKMTSSSIPGVTKATETFKLDVFL